MDYEIIVVGAGHAGCEAAHAAALKNHKTLLLTSNLKNIADMPCNPHIGGSAKGIVVREIDALGGVMGKIADKTHLQIKMLNSAKGPAVQSLRAQGDKIAYPKEMIKELKSHVENSSSSTTHARSKHHETFIQFVCDIPISKHIFNFSVYDIFSVFID